MQVFFLLGHLSTGQVLINNKACSPPGSTCVPSSAAGEGEAERGCVWIINEIIVLFFSTLGL